MSSPAPGTASAQGSVTGFAYWVKAAKIARTMQSDTMTGPCWRQDVVSVRRYQIDRIGPLTIRTPLVASAR